MKQYFYLLFSMIFMLHTTDAKMTSTKVKYFPQYRFIPPIDFHLIDTVNNVKSTMICAAICDRHIICRTADYNSVTKRCCLFESLAETGDFVTDSTTTILALNYCENDNQLEPEYVCTRSGVYSVQEMFNRLNASSSITLASTNRGAYTNMHGVYTSSTGGTVSFFSFTGQITNLVTISGEINNIHSATRNGLAIVRYNSNNAIVYRNQGTPSSPNLIQTVSITLPASPYACYATDQYLYVAYMSSQGFTVHNLSSGALLFSDTSGSSGGYRPVITLWKNTVIVLDQYRFLEFNLTGGYLGSTPYFTGFQANVRHFIHHDYAGRRYVCNAAGSHPGIFALLINGTRLGQATSICDRGMYVYITKEQASLVVASSTYMQVINF